MKLLKISSSARFEGSITRQIGNYLVAQLGGELEHRDLGSQPLPSINSEDLIDLHSSQHSPRLSLQSHFEHSQLLIDELNAADTLILEAPMYNFSVPVALKQWVDAICLAGHTFRYTSDGPKGMVSTARVVIITASGGAPLGTDYDFVGPYLEQICRFIGITEVHHIRASGSKGDPQKLLTEAFAEVDKLMPELVSSTGVEG